MEACKLILIRYILTFLHGYVALRFTKFQLHRGHAVGPGDRLATGPDQLDAVAAERALVVERQRQVERRLAAERGQNGVGPLLDDGAQRTQRTVEIHRKPGYDPAELFIDPKIRFPKLAVASRLARKALGMRYLMDVIGLDATVVRGSHGRPTDREEDGPLFITSAPELLAPGPVPDTSVKSLLLAHLFPGTPRGSGPE